MSERFNLFEGNCLEVMKTMDADSIDSIVTDPPYELGFMGKSWDSSGIAFNVEVWQEALRVLKPGGHLIAFSGSRTYHRMAVAIEDAGFEIRDQIMWVYGSGFPKSHDVSKAIDKSNGKHERNLQPFADYVKQSRKSKGFSLAQLDEAMGTNTAASWWEGRKSGIQPPQLETYRQLKIVLDMDNRFDELIDWLEAEREVVGSKKSGIGTAFGEGEWASGQAQDVDITAPATAAAKQWQGWGTALKPAHEPMVLARKPLIGTVANNVLTFGTGGLNIDGSRVEGEFIETTNGNANAIYGDLSSNGGESWKSHNQGRWPANFIHDGSDEVVALFPDTGKSGVAVNRNRTGKKPNEVYEGGWGNLNEDVGFADSGSAARFFYCAKASKKDRNEGLDGFIGKEVGAKGNGLARQCATCGASVLDGCQCIDRTFVNPTRQNHHPTVKPTSLMQYLVRLVTPPNGIVLDPFLGSGSTGKAAMYEGFNFVGIELTPEYLPIAKARILFALKDKEGELDFEPR